jgi:hypothetical protein
MGVIGSRMNIRAPAVWRRSIIDRPNSTDLVPLVAILVALQFTAFGWRIAREIEILEQKRRTWLPVPDILNIISMLSVIVSGVVLPLAHGKSSSVAKAIVAMGFVLIAFHPLSMAGHYCIFSKNGRDTYLGLVDAETGKSDWRYFPPPEICFVAISLIATALVGWYVLRLA